MAATAPPLRSFQQEQTLPRLEHSRIGVVAVSMLTILAVMVHGYHPYAEDGGLYLAGVKRVLDPHLYPYWTGFTTAHLRFSLFAPAVAFLVRSSHLPLMAVMLILYVGTIWATLFAAWHLAIRCFSRTEECLGGLVLLALLLTVPVAGTSLMLMDPYVSARSISTPCGLFALVAVADMAGQINRREGVSHRSIILGVGCLFLAIVVHPLMGTYALGSALVLGIAILLRGKLQWIAYGALSLASSFAAVLLLGLAPATPHGYFEVARTRSYWFLSTWHWYELVGILVPLLILAAWRYLPSSPPDAPIGSFAQMGLVVGTLSIFIAILFARMDMSSYVVARLQPLRVFQIIYCVTILFVGAFIGRIVLERSAWRWIALFATLGPLMAFVQLATFPHSSHLELPWTASTNPWEQAFIWIRQNTPNDAIVAMDAAYINAPGEDAQNFRAIAERSALPDYSKDGGITSIAPDLTADWIHGVSAQTGLDDATDAHRIAALSPWGVQWVVLLQRAATSFQCDYSNHQVKVCRVPNSASKTSRAR